MLGSIATMYIRRDELAPNLPLVLNGGLKFGADFIVKDLEIDVVPTVGKAAHDGAIDGQLVFVGPVDIRGKRIALQRLWKAMVVYWLPMQAWMGSLLVSLV